MPAARLLRPYVAAHPGDVEAARLLGETLYWLKDPAGARLIFEAALANDPSSVDLRLTYARMLIETGDRSRARQLLEPLVGSRGSHGRAEAQLGIAAYWAGDLSTARRLLAAALAADSANSEARTALRQILAAGAPRLQVSTYALRDDQPLDRTGVRLTMKASPAPLLALSAHVEPTRFAIAAGNAVALLLAEGGVGTRVAPLRAELDLVGGIVARETRSDWTGRAVAGIHPSPTILIRGRVERSQYLHTLASIHEPVAMQTVGATVEWSHRGWLAHAAVSRDRFADDNGISTGYVWMLAPVVRAPAGELHVGYAFTAQDADESRYEIVSGTAPPEGAHVPYHTPLDLRSHQVLGSFVLRAGTRITLTGNAGYGRAQDIGERVVRRSAGPFQPPTYAIEREVRAFAPWNARTSVDARLNSLLSLTASIESMRTAFYRATTLRAGVTQTFSTPSLRRLGRP